MWANVYLLFWLTLFPFGTGWMEESRFAPAPTAAYGLILMMAGIGYLFLQRQILKLAEPDSALRREIGKDFKGNACILLYALGVGLAFCEALGGLPLLCAGGGDVADPRPADRTGAGRGLSPGFS